MSDRFEPGSTMKPFTIAAALAAGAINARSSIDCEMGEWDIGEDTIHDSHPLGVLSPSQVLSHSSNIGIAKVGFLLGRERLYRSLRRFGFGQRVTTILPGETTGDLRYFDRWYDMDLASISFGQGVSVTTLQLASAMSGIANRGRLMETLLVRQTSAEDHSVIARFEPHLDREVVSASTARLVAEMLTAVTGEDGTGEEASLDGYLVAGKTGTAQKADTVHGGYAAGRWVASFVGFVPVDAPRLVIAVVIDEPTIEYHGGVVAAPVFRRVASEALAIQGVPRSDANRLPRAPTAPSDHRAERVRTAPNAVPDFMGLNARDAMRLAGRANVHVRTLGTGVVVAQDPLPFVPQPGVEQVVELRLDLPSETMRHRAVEEQR